MHSFVILLNDFIIIFLIVMTITIFDFESFLLCLSHLAVLDTICGKAVHSELPMGYVFWFFHRKCLFLPKSAYGILLSPALWSVHPRYSPDRSPLLWQE